MDLPAQPNELEELRRLANAFLRETGEPIRVIRTGVSGRTGGPISGSYPDYGEACVATELPKLAGMTLVTSDACLAWERLAPFCDGSLKFLGRPRTHFRREFSERGMQRVSEWAEEFEFQTGDPHLPIASLQMVAKRELALRRKDVTQLLGLLDQQLAAVRRTPPEGASLDGSSASTSDAIATADPKPSKGARKPRYDEGQKRKLEVLLRGYVQHHAGKVTERAVAKWIREQLPLEFPRVSPATIRRLKSWKLLQEEHRPREIPMGEVWEPRRPDTKRGRAPGKRPQHGDD